MTREKQKTKYKIRGACLVCVVDPWYILPHLSLTPSLSLICHFCHKNRLGAVGLVIA